MRNFTPSLAAVASTVAVALYREAAGAWPRGRSLVVGLFLAFAVLAASATAALAATVSDLSVSKSGPSAVAPGETIGYTLNVTNAGPDAAGGVTLTDTLPGDTVFVSLAQNSAPPFSCTTPAAGAGGTVSCTSANLAAGATSVFTLVAMVPEGTPVGTAYTNTASVTSETSDPNASSSVTTTVGAPEPGTLRFERATYEVDEDAGTTTITVVREGGSDGEVKVDYATADGTATAGSDYTATSGTLTFADGETSKTFVVAVTDDARDEPDETVSVALSNPQGGATLGSPSTAVLTIDDASLPPPPSDPTGCTIKGSSGKDALRGTERRDVICAFGGDDAIRGMGGNDLILGGGGDDVIQGGKGDDTLEGQNGNDTLQGQEGDDRLYGGEGRDTLQGGSGRDTLQGGSGRDVTQQ